MRILCVIDNLGPGGAQRQLVELASGFKEKGNEVYFLTYYNLPFFIPVLEASDIPVDCIAESNYFRRLIRMRSYIRRNNFDAVLSFLEGANFICEFAGIPFRKWKLIVGERSANWKVLNSFKLRFYRWFHVFADYIVANSNSNINIILKVNPFLSRSKCKVISNVVDFNKWNSNDRESSENNKKLKLIVTASHIYLKNLNGLIKALALLEYDELNRIEIEWYGDRLTEPYYDMSFPEAKTEIERLHFEKIISFFPATNKIVEIIKSADIIGLFSFIEGLPNVICEAMACSKPVICSRISDIPSILTYDENLLFDPNDPVSIKKSISYVINMDRDQLKEIGLKNESISKEKFNKDCIISEYLKLLSP